eukprot:6392655-Lingulodinium_polyedra.AAC.1
MRIASSSGGFFNCSTSGHALIGRNMFPHFLDMGWQANLCTNDCVLVGRDVLVDGHWKHGNTAKN